MTMRRVGEQPSQTKELKDEIIEKACNLKNWRDMQH